MIEQKIEDAVLAKVQAALSAVGVEAQYMGQLRAVDAVKAVENAKSDVFVVAKASPRQYGTPTMPTCQINVQLNALVRADVDYSGADYLAVTGKIMEVLQRWQRCYDDTHEDFTVEGEFDCTGFQLGSGSFQLDASGKTWQYSHQMTVFGVVLE
jgi:hypothetical protein